RVDVMSWAMLPPLNPTGDPRGASPSMNCTVPDGKLPATEAVKTTACPNGEGFAEETTLVVVGKQAPWQVVIRPIRLPPGSVNHRLPSGPAVMPLGYARRLMPALNSVTTPSGVIRPIRSLAPRSLPRSVNQTLPSGPAVMQQVNAPPVWPSINS